MANRYRGEIFAMFDGKPYTLCLTLGALAELETLFGDEDMVALATRFENGRISARDAQRIIGAGLRGAGCDIADDLVANMKVDGGAAGYVDVVARLLQATFGGSQECCGTDQGSKTRAGEADDDGSPREGGSAVPFPGGT